MTNFIDKIYEKVDNLLETPPPQKFKLKNKKHVGKSTVDNTQDAWNIIDTQRKRSPSPPKTQCKTCNGYVVLDQTDGDYVCEECGMIADEMFMLDHDETKFHDYESDQDQISIAQKTRRHGIITTHVTKEESFDISLSRDLASKYPWMSGSIIKQICAILNRLSQQSDCIFRTQKRLGLVSVAYWISMLLDHEYISPERVCRIFNCQMGQFKKCLGVIRKYDKSINDYLSKNMNEVYIKMYVYDKLYENKLLPIKYADGIVKMFYSIKTDLKISKQTLAYVCCYVYLNQKSIILRNINPNIVSIAKKINLK